MHRFCEVYFVDCSSQQILENDLATLALFKKVGKTPQDGLLWLSHHHKEWLMVFNNADNIHLNLVRYFPSGSHGNIIITSRNPDLAQHAHEQHKVDRMDVEEAADLLLSAAEYPLTVEETREIAKQLVQKLYCLPLAVSKAGANISLSLGLHKYLELYENTTRRMKLLNQSPTQSDYDRSVYAT
ncbi:hypothetical protein B0H17DRAFT_1248697 [Mycena rosella]|uniref:NB-ARC domain-containing protein n=1 Tax=Mycena rosella TaxID=1033263 RepID=A0AAD7CXJ7_MYCRO|nr:hypothetical protein B0H17DRAFT_1248697 [Mycena rosella]